MASHLWRGHDLRQQLLDSISRHGIEAITENKLPAARAQKWQALGPECGPEVCVEEACKRLRIKLAVRCFMHQIWWRGI